MSDDREMAGRARKILWDLLGKSTVYRQYLKHIDRGRVGLDNRNTLPWHAEGERQYAAFLLSSVGSEGGATMLNANPEASSQAWETVCVGAAFQVMAAPVYLWFEEIEDLADSTPLPRHVVSANVMPAPVMFWSRDVARGAGWGGENNWLVLRHQPEGIEIFADISVGWNDIKIGGGMVVEYGKTFPDDFSGNQLDWARRILSRLAFMNSPYVMSEEGRLPRAWRREALRKAQTAPLAEPTIRVVKLRREARESIDRQRAEIATTERRSHWWVSGHHRAQWYPSKKAHEVIWIAPYLKGDLSKPLAKKVYAVTR